LQARKGISVCPERGKKSFPPLQFNGRLFIWTSKRDSRKKNFLTPAAGIFNYKGQPWADDNRALFAFYYLATACLYFPRFEDGENVQKHRHYSLTTKHILNQLSHPMTLTSNWKMPSLL
jgi:hypothetical protein